jgi:succinoglycan biosynthesis transport protein ExoP
MEIRNFFIYLSRFKYVLITVPILALLLAFLLVRRLPNSYASKTQVVTGIVDQTQQVIESQGTYGRESKNNEQFVSLMETLQLDKVLDQVSFELMLHDLNSNNPFSRNDEVLNAIPAASKSRIVSLLNIKKSNFGVLDVSNPIEKLTDSLIRKLGYDHESLLKNNLRLFHAEGSDLINIESEADNPILSAFIVNTLSSKFITYYTNNVNAGHGKSTDFLSKLLVQKRDAMNKKIADLQNYKVAHGILDMGDASKDVYGQINDLETHRQQAEKDVIAYSGALKSIDNKFNPKDRRYFEATAAKINSNIIATRERTKAANDRYIQNNFRPKDKKTLDSLQDVLSAQINESSDSYISNPLAAKENIVQEKLKMENELQLAKYSAGSLAAQVNKLKGKMSSLVPAQAVVSSLNRDIDVATREYLDVQDKYSQANVSTKMPVQLRVLQQAMPGKLKGSKKMLLVALSGITAFVLCLVVLLVVFYLDNSVKSSDDLEQQTRIPVIGQLNYLPNIRPGSKTKIDSVGNTAIFRDLLRAIRFEIDNEMQNNKILAVTSLNGAEGKTLFAFSLAHAYAMTNKKVLLIDGNFSSPVISQTVKSKEFLEDYFSYKQPEDPSVSKPAPKQLSGGEEKPLLEITNNSTMGGALQQLNAQYNFNYNHKSTITVLGNKGGDVSLLEINGPAQIAEKMELLKLKYDIILIEAGPLDTLNKSKEWIKFADKTIAVFENNKSIKKSHKRQLNYLRGLNGSLIGWVLNKVNIKNGETEMMEVIS